MDNSLLTAMHGMTEKMMQMQAQVMQLECLLQQQWSQFVTDLL
jgi:hypothetical protein